MIQLMFNVKYVFLRLLLVDFVKYTHSVLEVPVCIQKDHRHILLTPALSVWALTPRRFITLLFTLSKHLVFLYSREHNKTIIHLCLEYTPDKYLPEDGVVKIYWFIGCVCLDFKIIFSSLVILMKHNFNLQCGLLLSI